MNSQLNNLLNYLAIKLPTCGAVGLSKVSWFINYINTQIYISLSLYLNPPKTNAEGTSSLPVLFPKKTTASATPRACSNTARCSFPLRSAGGHARHVCHKFDDFI